MAMSISPLPFVEEDWIGAPSDGCAVSSSAPQVDDVFLNKFVRQASLGYPRV